jgi:MSHA biogenesis protein MshJ
LLERTLARHERLTLRKLATVAEPPFPAASAAASKSALPVLRWQGVDLAVNGRYADLVEYLSALEGALPGLRWDALKLTGSATEPSTLALRLYLVENTP